MNIQQVLADMLTAAQAAAQAHWPTLRGFAEQEFRALATASAQLEADYLLDRADALQEATPAARVAAERRAKRRAELAFDSIRLAGEGLVITVKADAKIAAQDAINAALRVLTKAINTAVGLPLL